MAKIAIISGLLLIILGLYAYFGISSESVTALIPAFFGLPVFILGIVGLNEKYLKHALHGAAVIMLLGFIGTGVRAIPKMLAGEYPPAVVVQIIMMLICFVFTVLAIKSFVDVRQAREKAAKG